MVIPSDRLPWLRRDPHGYRPQAYEHLASVYRRLGHDRDARTIMLANERHRRESLGFIAKIWGYARDYTVGYGYRPARAVAWFLFLLAVGTVAFASNPPHPAQLSPPVQFSPLVYTLDLLLPLVDFGLRDIFIPRGGWAWLAYGLIGAGWILVTTIATATRTLRRT